MYELMQDWTFDQSNWVELVLPGESDLTLDDMSLLGQTIVGKLVDNVNPTIELVANPIPNQQMNFPCLLYTSDAADE